MDSIAEQVFIFQMSDLELLCGKTCELNEFCSLLYVQLVSTLLLENILSIILAKVETYIQIF